MIGAFGSYVSREEVTTAKRKDRPCPNTLAPGANDGKTKMHRTDILSTANSYITQDRAATHGDAEDSFSQIGAAWTWWLNERLTAPISAHDVAMMMTLFKLARTKGNPTHIDNAIDGCGYLAIAGELATGDD